MGKVEHGRAKCCLKCSSWQRSRCNFFKSCDFMQDKRGAQTQNGNGETGWTWTVDGLADDPVRFFTRKG